MYFVALRVLGCGLGLILTLGSGAREMPIFVQRTCTISGDFFYQYSDFVGVGGYFFFFFLILWLFSSVLLSWGVWRSAYFKGCKGWLYYLSCTNCPCHHCIAVVSLVLCLTYKVSVPGNKVSKKTYENKTNSHLKLALRRCRVQRLVPLHRFQGLFLNALEQLCTGGNIMDQTDDLTGSPDLKWNG